MINEARITSLLERMRPRCPGEKFDTLEVEAIEQGGLIAIGNGYVRIELHDIVVCTDTADTVAAAAAWERRATLHLAEATLRAARNDAEQMKAARTILRLSDEAAWRHAAHDVVNQIEARA